VAVTTHIFDRTDEYLGAAAVFPDGAGAGSSRTTRVPPSDGSMTCGSNWQAAKLDQARIVLVEGQVARASRSLRASNIPRHPPRS
jgi:hypothetical protein